MHEDLFRREMLDARKQRWLGSIRLPISRLGWPMAALALLGLLALLALLGFGRYTRSEPVEGVLITQAASNGASSVQAQLWVPDRAIAAIRPGTPAVLRYRAFPYQRYGVQRGRVLAIAAEAWSPDEIHRRSGLRLDAPAWPVRVELDRQRIGTQALRAGMRVDAELQLERRRLYEFVLAPLSNEAASASPGTGP